MISKKKQVIGLFNEKQAQDAYFSNRTNEDSSLFKTYNDRIVETIYLQKHLGLILDEDLISTNI